LTLFEVSDASSLVTELCDPEANIIFGTSVRDDLDDNVMLTVIATDFE
ncbi:MAG: cell division protein FtsZ, partial [Clostridiales bacterium]|nr:cell division protein FtsZ [Clostridiales bacterium]MDY4134357.1 cell division protein FtsZ [Terrisporobacter sp.]